VTSVFGLLLRCCTLVCFEFEGLRFLTLLLFPFDVGSLLSGILLLSYLLLGLWYINYAYVYYGDVEPFVRQANKSMGFVKKLYDELAFSTNVNFY